MEKVYFNGVILGVGDTVYWLESNYFVEGVVVFGCYEVSGIHFCGYCLSVKNIILGGKVCATKDTLVDNYYSLLDVIKNRKVFDTVSKSALDHSLVKLSAARKFIREMVNSNGLYALAEKIDEIDDLEFSKAVIRCIIEGIDKRGI